MQTPDFTSPVPRTSISGFPVRFRKDRLCDSLTLYVPQRITRNRQSRGWRILINHADGQLKLWEPDAGRTPLESLNAAWVRLVEKLNDLPSPIRLQRRRSLPGRSRDPVIDTGVDGVLIARHKARANRSKAIGIQMIQRLSSPTATSEPCSIRVFSLSESMYLESPRVCQARFEQGLCLATAIRHKYLDCYSRLGPVPEPVTVYDVDQSDIPHTPVITLSLSNIFDSF